MIDYPKDATLIIPEGSPQLTAEQVAVSLQCLLRPMEFAKIVDGEEETYTRHFKLHHTSGIKGRGGDEWCEASSLWEGGTYTWNFFVRDNCLTNVFKMRTPKGATYCLNRDGGNVFLDLTIKEQQQLTEMLIGPHSGKDHGVELIPAWIICINGARPYCGGHVFFDEGDAEKAFEEQKVFYNQHQARLAALPPEPVKKKAEPIAFKAKKAGTTKKK